MNLDQEILRLQDLLPASWRMTTVISSATDQGQAIASTPVTPWKSDTQISLNPRLWLQLGLKERDLLLIREVAWRQQGQWLKFGVYQTVAVMAISSMVMQFAQGDTVGVAVGAGLLAIASNQIWRRNRSSQVEIEADNEALSVAVKRGYPEVAAAKNLLDGILAMAKLEGRNELEFVELIRCQNLRAIAGLSAVTVPSDFE
jgi:hypothetical protein